MNKYIGCAMIWECFAVACCVVIALVLCPTVSRGSATGSSGDEIGKALASVSRDSLVFTPQAPFKTPDTKF